MKILKYAILLICFCAFFQKVFALSNFEQRQNIKELIKLEQTLANEKTQFLKEKDNLNFEIENLKVKLEIANNNLTRLNDKISKAQKSANDKNAQIEDLRKIYNDIKNEINFSYKNFIDFLNKMPEPFKYNFLKNAPAVNENINEQNSCINKAIFMQEKINQIICLNEEINIVEIKTHKNILAKAIFLGLSIGYWSNENGTNAGVIYYNNNENKWIFKQDNSIAINVLSAIKSFNKKTSSKEIKLPLL